MENVEENIEKKPRRLRTGLISVAVVIALMGMALSNAIPGISLTMNAQAVDSNPYGAGTHIESVKLYTNADNNAGTARTILAEFTSNGGTVTIRQNDHMDAFTVICHASADMDSFLTTNSLDFSSGTQLSLVITAPDSSTATYALTNYGMEIGPYTADLGDDVTQVMYMSVAQWPDQADDNSDINYVFNQVGDYHISVVWSSLQ